MKQPPRLSPRSEAARAARRDRLARALRDNLRRRKEQARAQGEHDGGAALSGAAPSAKSKRRDGETVE